MFVLRRTFALRVISALTMVLLLVACNALRAGTDENSSQSKQNIWWDDGQLVKGAIVSALALQAANPSLRSDPKFTEHMSSVTDLLLLFDSMESKKGLQALAELTSYYLGEHPHEIFSCLLRRKGKVMQPILTGLLASKRNECISKIGEPKLNPQGLEVSVCLSEVEYRKQLADSVAAIGRGTPCIIEQ